MRRLLTAVLLIALLTFAGLSTGCAKGEFVGSSVTGKYHRPDCIWADEMKSENEVWFQDKAAAEAAEYVPCGNCLGGI